MNTGALPDLFTTFWTGERPPNPEERRYDPHDGQARTFAELQALSAKDYTPKQIEDYWHRECRPWLGTRNLAQDPFLTSVPHGPIDAGAPHQDLGTRQLTSLNENPFLTGIRAPRTTDLGQVTRNFSSEAKHLKDNGLKAFFAMLGPGDTTRIPAAQLALVLGPFSVYLWMHVLWMILYHWSPVTCTALTVAVGLASAAILLLWSLGNWRTVGPAPLLPFGVMCCLAVLAGTLVACEGYQLHWRQFWWAETGQYFDLTAADTPAGSRVDGAVLAFRDSKGTYNGTSVDYLRSAGYKDTNMYCVAPILSPAASGSPLLLVNYWAVGINCCQESGGFACDDSRRTSGGYGVVQLQQGFPCPKCHNAEFQKALSKASALHGLVSAPGAMFVRWVASADRMKSTELIGGVLYLLLSLAYGLAVCGVVGSLAWYYGIGKDLKEEQFAKSK